MEKKIEAQRRQEVKRRQETMENVLKQISNLNKNIYGLNPLFDKILSDVENIQRNVRTSRDRDLLSVFQSSKIGDIVKIISIAKGGISRVSSKVRKIESEKEDIIESISVSDPTFY
jgi:hypothetical protein